MLFTHYDGVVIGGYEIFVVRLLLKCVKYVMVIKVTKD